jgi:hypothetical protein
MSCLIEQRETFNLITLPEGALNAAIKEELIHHSQDSMAQRQSIIVDFSKVKQCEIENVDFIQTLHSDVYSDNLSFVITQASDTIKQAFNYLLEEDSINYAPTLAEAIDIVSMENIERELLGEG